MQLDFKIYRSSLIFLMDEAAEGGVEMLKSRQPTWNDTANKMATRKVALYAGYQWHTLSALFALVRVAQHAVICCFWSDMRKTWKWSDGWHQHTLEWTLSNGLSLKTLKVWKVFFGSSNSAALHAENLTFISLQTGQWATATFRHMSQLVLLRWPLHKENHWIAFSVWDDLRLIS